MEFFLLIGVLVAAVWGAVVIRYQSRFRLNPIAIIGGLTILVGTVFGHSFYNTNVGPIPITLDRLLLGGVVLFFGIRFLRNRESIRVIDRIDMIVIGYLGVLSVSTFTHDWTFRDNMPMSQLLFFNFLPICLYFITKNCQLQDRDIRWIFVSFAGFGVYLSLTAFAETREWTWAVFPKYINDPTVTEFLGRGRGPLHNPVANGMLIVIGCCCSLLLLPHLRKKDSILYAIGGMSILAGVLGSYSTLTRIIWFSLAVTMFLLTWAPMNKKAKLAYGGVGALAAVMIVVVASTGVLNSFKRDKHVTVHEMSKSAGLRVVFFVIAKDMFFDAPVFGHGFAQYRQAKNPYLMELTEGNVETALGKSYIQHNIILSFLTETGLIGTVVLLGMLGTFGFVGWFVWFDPLNSLAARQTGILLLAFVVVFFITGMVQDVTVIPMANNILFFLAGLGSNVYCQRFAPAAVPSLAASYQSVDSPSGQVSATY